MDGKQQFGIGSCDLQGDAPYADDRAHASWFGDN